MTSRPRLLIALLTLSFFQPASSNVISAAAQQLNPPHLSDMPSVDKVMQVMKTNDPAETALRQIGAFYQLEEIIKALSGRREFRGLTPDEARILGAYHVAEYNLTQAADKQFSPPAGFRTFSAQTPYRYSRWDPRFGVEGIQTFKLLLSPAVKAQFDSIIAGDNARREARNQENQSAATPVAAQPTGTPKPGSTAEARKCVESGRSVRICLTESMNAGLYELPGLGINELIKAATEPGLRMTGDYASATGFRLIFLPNKVSMVCRGVPSPQPYWVEVTDTQTLVKIQHGSKPVVFALRGDGKLSGAGPIRITGQVPAGTRTEQTMGTTSQTTTRQRTLSPGEERYYPNAVKNGPVYTVTEDTTELTYGPTGTRTVTEYTTKTVDCNLGLMTPIGPTPVPPDIESPFGILGAIFSGTAVLMQGGSLQSATKEMLSVDDAPPPGLRMTGSYVGQNDFSIKFNPESATLSCGEAARALKYSINRNGNQTQLNIQDNTNPTVLQLKPDGSLVGDGSVQVNGRQIVGSTQDPKNPFIFAPRVARCTVGSLYADGHAPANIASSSGTPSSRVPATPVPTTLAPTTPAPTTPAPATNGPSAPGTTQVGEPAALTISSGLVAAPGGPNPLAGKTIIVLRESFESILAKAGWIKPGSRSSALATWARACEVQDPSCRTAIDQMRPYFISSATFDNSGWLTFTNARSGTFYLVVQTTANGVHLVWDLRIDVKPGANSITLDQRNATPINQ